MDGIAVAKTALEIVRLGGQTVAGLNLNPVVTLAAGAVAGAAAVALGALDNAEKSEGEALAALKRTLASSIAEIDLRLGDLDAARAAAKAKIAAAFPPDPITVATGDLVAAVQKLPADANTDT